MGSKEWVPQVSNGKRSPQLERLFPRLASGDYGISSPETRCYNCIAWAVGEDDRWWWPGEHPDSFWPDEIPQDHNVQSFVDAFSTLGYGQCSDGNPEEGIEKVAIYMDDEGKTTHAARQLSNGGWTSKLGGLEDIEHDLADLEGEQYGHVTCFLKRPR